MKLQKVSDMSLSDWIRSVFKSLIIAPILGLYLSGLIGFARIGFDFDKLEAMGYSYEFAHSCIIISLIITIIAIIFFFIVFLFWVFEIDAGPRRPQVSLRPPKNKNDKD